jgi:acylphosphatase
MSAVVHKQVLASGRVQGVSYRFFVMETARALKLTGWVRNLADGRVEAEVQGDEDTVNQLIEAMRKGPRMAHVTELVIIPLAFENRYTDFQVRHDG